MSARSIAKKTVALAMLLASAVAALPAPAQAIEYGGFGGRPAYPRADNPRTDSIFIHTLEPGATVEDGIKVLNNTADRKTVLVYATDSTPSTGGAFACKQLSEQKVGVGSWIALEKNEVTLEPGSSEIVPFTITAPLNADVGENNGCILMQEKREGDGGRTSGLSLSVRTGLRVAVTVPGDIVRQLAVADFSVAPRSGGFLLRPQVRNDGNVSIDADVRVRTDSVFGTTLASQGGEYPVLRGEMSEWNFEIKKPFWGGWYRSQLVVAYDADPDAGVGSKTSQPPVLLESPPVTFFSPPTLAGLLVELAVLLTLCAAGALFWLWRKRERWISETWQAYEVASGDDLHSLSVRHHVSWRLLAKVNLLKPPYVLRANQKIRVPPFSEL